MSDDEQEPPKEKRKPKPDAKENDERYGKKKRIELSVPPPKSSILKTQISKHQRISIKPSYIDPTQFLDFDDLLPLIGEFGMFQKILFLLMIPFCYIAAFIYLGQIFITMAPHKYYCQVQELLFLETEEERMNLSIPKQSDGTYSHCLMYDDNYTAIRLSKEPPTEPNTTLPQIPCKQGYVYDDEVDPFYSATMEFEWLCEKDLYATYAQIVFFLGSVLGCLGYGHLADRIGRLPTLVSSCFLGLIGSLFTSMAENYMAFLVTRLMAGTAFDTSFTMIYVLAMEYVGPKYRTIMAHLALAFFYVPFTCLIPWLAYYLGEWRMFSCFAALPLAIALFSYCLIPESARWLVSTGKVADGILIMTRVVKSNSTYLPPVIVDHFHYSCQKFFKEEVECRRFTVCSIFKRRRLCCYMILMIVIWMIISLIYDAHVRSPIMMGPGEDLFTRFSLACLMELPGNLLLIGMIGRLERRWSALVITVLCGLSSLLTAHFLDAEYIFGAALAGRFFANISFNIGLLWAAEILPTAVRVQGIGFIHLLGVAAMLISPPIAYLTNISMSPTLTSLGVLGVVAGLLMLLLPETLHDDLPLTLSDSDTFGKNQRIWHSPCYGRRDSKRTRQLKRIWHTGSSLRNLSRDEWRSPKMHRNAFVVIARPSKRPSTRRSDDDIPDAEQIEKTYKF